MAASDVSVKSCGTRMCLKAIIFDPSCLARGANDMPGVQGSHGRQMRELRAISGEADLFVARLVAELSPHPRKIPQRYLWWPAVRPQRPSRLGLCHHGAPVTSDPSFADA